MPNKLTPEQWRLVAKRYVEDRIGMRLLAEEFSVSTPTIHRVLVELGIPRVGPSGLSGVRDKEPEVVRLAQEGLSQVEIGQRVGIAQVTVGRVLRRNGVDAMKATGSRHGQWKGGRSRVSGGYTAIRILPEDPLWQMSNSAGYVLEHRLVVARSLGRCLTTRETVHHINGNRIDNRLENLQLRSGNHGKGAAARCRACGSPDVEFAAIE